MRLAFPVSRISVRRGVVLTSSLLVAIAVAQLAFNLRAFSSAAFMLHRAETSYRQLTSYQQLSIDVLEYITSRQVPVEADRQTLHPREAIESDLAGIDALEISEVGLVHENGGNETNETERRRLARIRSTIEVMFSSNEARTGDPAAGIAATYRTVLKPMMADAISGEQAEIVAVEADMRRMQAQVSWFGRIGILVQIGGVGLILLVITRRVLDPISRLVADIREFGRDRLGHRVDIRRHDEFGLLAQHINRMARHLERGRQSLVSVNTHLERTVADRTRSLQERNEELREIDESRRRFFADVSHELRTPLTAIVGEADVTLRVEERDAKVCRDALASILANSKYLNRRIDDLMALARSSDGRLEQHFESVDLNLVVVEAMAEIRSLARVNCVAVHFEPRDAPILVDGDKARLRQCLMILLDNAVKFSRAYQAIDVALVDRGAHVDLTIADQGKGIAVQELPHVFERFYQTEVGRRMGGTGLGLSIARRIVDAHEGEIAARSNGGSGTAITITLPVAESVEG